MGFFPPFSFQFHVDYVNKSDVSASRNSFQNAAIHEKKNTYPADDYLMPGSQKIF